MMAARAILRAGASAATALVLGWSGLAMMNDGPSTDPSAQHSPTRRVSVRLLGPAEVITGIDVPKGLVNQGDTYLRVEEPADVTVQLPGGRTIRQRVKSISVNVNHGVVVDIHLLPLPKSVPYREAIAELRRLLCAMGIEPDERMRKQMATWPDDSPGYSVGFYPLTYRTGVDLSESVAVEVVVRPADDGGWFLALTLAAAGDARRAVWDPAFKAAPEPSAEEKGKEPDQKPSRK
jgi:hypothetical protein